eukprot:scpid83113/ scgid7507/ 
MDKCSCLAVFFGSRLVRHGLRLERFGAHLLELIFLADPEDEDILDVLLMKYLEREQDLADAAAKHRLLDFSFESLPEASFHERFRFMKSDIPTQCSALEIPNKFVPPNRTTWSGTGANLTPDQRGHNARMSECRICVEWGFGEINQRFGYLDLKKN